MRHALVENEKIVNIIEIDPRNAIDFENAVAIPENIFAGIGDIYRAGVFYTIDPETKEEKEILPYDPLDETKKHIRNLNAKMEETTIEMDFRILELESLNALAQTSNI